MVSGCFTPPPQLTYWFFPKLQFGGFSFSKEEKRKWLPEIGYEKLVLQAHPVSGPLRTIRPRDEISHSFQLLHSTPLNRPIGFFQSSSFGVLFFPPIGHEKLVLQPHPAALPGDFVSDFPQIGLMKIDNDREPKRQRKRKSAGL